MIAHAGGLDEILLAGAVVALLFLLRRPRSGGEDRPREGPCLYCGARLGPGDTRCPSCGFRSGRGPTSSPTDGGR